ncbi:thiamine-phosphate kinase [Sphingomonas sp. 3-13AW]|uniref:thiamine-phosphate kinase n=1 Tax=Sphingomonas sp. 3-13AW TaxID=3050450 RepID=UPI003BB4C625
MTEAEFLAELRALPLHPAARRLADDAAVLPAGDMPATVLTTDLLVEGVHFLPGDPAGDVAWKLLATNLSDLAAKGAAPIGVLLGFPLGDDNWDRAFLAGLRTALAAFDCPLLGGDTVRQPAGGPRFLALTALGHSVAAPARDGAQAGDGLWVTGTIGDAGAGLAIARGAQGPQALLDRYRRPNPRLAEGRALAPHVRAMMDVSDGLLIDASRMAAASGVGVAINLAAMPRSADLRGQDGDSQAARIAAATAGDDYELLFAMPGDALPPVPATRVGSFVNGAGLHLTDAGTSVALPPRLGFEHHGS